MVCCISEVGRGAHSIVSSVSPESYSVLCTLWKGGAASGRGRTCSRVLMVSKGCTMHCAVVLASVPATVWRFCSSTSPQFRCCSSWLARSFARTFCGDRGVCEACWLYRCASLCRCSRISLRISSRHGSHFAIKYGQSRLKLVQDVTATRMCWLARQLCRAADRIRSCVPEAM